MLTMHERYDELRRRVAPGATYIISLTDGTDTWYLSDRAIVLVGQGITTLELVQSVSRISEKLNLVSREWGVAETIITLYNKPFFKSNVTADAGMLLRPSDKFSGIYGKTVEIYIWPGPAATYLSTDCLKIFSGTIQEFPEADQNTMTIIASAEPAALSMKVPDNFITTADYPDAPEDSIHRFIPIVYGTVTEGDYLNYRGLIPCERIAGNKFVVHDAASANPTGIWVYAPELKQWVKLYDSGDYTLNPSDGGTTTVKIDTSFPRAYAYLYPDDGYADNAMTAKQLPEEVVDHNATTGHSLISETTPDIGATAKTGSVILLWAGSFGSSESLHAKIGRILTQNPAGDLAAADRLAFQYRFAMAGGYTNSNNQALRFMAGYNADSPGTWRLMYNPVYYPLMTGNEYASTPGANSFRTVFLDYTGTASNLDWTHATTGIHWHPGDGESGGSYAGYPFAIRVILEVNEAASAGTAIGYLYEARLRIPFELNWGARVAGRTGAYRKDWISQMAVEGYGRLYGAWLKVGGRTNPGGYSVANAISSPPYIIESLLRDTAGVATANIDTASFDDCEATRPASLTHQVVLTGEGKYGEAGDDRPTLKEVITDICRQYPGAFYWTSSGKARMINLTPYRMNNPSATTIPYHDIDQSTITIGKTPLRDLVNYLKVDVLLRVNDEKYTYSEVGKDSTSQTTYWLKEGNLRAPYINNSTGLAWMISYWMGQPAGLTLGYFLSRPKLPIKFTCPGIKWAHLEIGDWIQMDSEFDTKIKLMGQSWAGVYFIITEKTQTKNGVEFTAIRPLVDATKGL